MSGSRAAAAEPVPLPAYFAPSGTALVPDAGAAGTWDPTKVHGRLLAGLMARAVDEIARQEGLACARLTVDLLRPAALAPVEVRADLVQRRRRAATVDAFATVGGATAGRASAVLVEPSATPPGDVWAAGPWAAPPPDRVAPISDDQRRLLPWDARPAHGPELVTAERKGVWVHDPRALVADEQPSPLVRLATLADAVNPVANSGTRGLRYVNADLTVYLARPPTGEWFGFEVQDHVAESGIAVGLCRVHDTEGPLGLVATAGLAMGRPARTRRDSP